jgi:hypothetical protein
MLPVTGKKIWEHRYSEHIQTANKLESVMEKAA